jgi:hypothetical protein
VAASTATSAGVCSDVKVQIQGAPVDVEFGPGCQFVVRGVPVVTDLTVTIEVAGVTKTLDLTDLRPDEVIEVTVDLSGGEPAVGVVRRAPEAQALLPEVIDANGVNLSLPAGEYAQDLLVNGNNFTLVGATVEGGCDAEGWTTIAGDVTIDGNSATFQNIRFGGNVVVSGGAALFVRSCFQGVLTQVGGPPDGGSGPGDGTGGVCPEPFTSETADFENLDVGTPLAGDGAASAHPDLAIATDVGTPAVTDLAGLAGCQTGRGVWVAAGGGIPQSFAFDFGGKTVSRFSVQMLDFGDELPADAHSVSVELLAYKADGTPVAPQAGDVTKLTLPEPLPPPADLAVSGDACTAQTGDPGNFTFSISGAGIAKVEIVSKGGVDPNVAFDKVAFDLDLEQLEVPLDIKPGSPVNPINLGSHGVTPVALINDGCFDLARLDLGTVQFAGAYAAKSHLEDVDGDGDADLILHFPTDALLIAPNAVEASLTARTLDGVLVTGTDTVRIVGGGKKNHGPHDD